MSFAALLRCSSKLSDLEAALTRIRAAVDTRRVTTPGIHAHPTRKLGRRPENRAKPKIRFGTLLTAAPDHPLVDRGPDYTFGMDHNDEAGDCVVAGVNHTLQVIHGLLGTPYVPWTDEQVLRYYQTQNRDFKSWADAGTDADQGMIIADFLSFLVKEGTILGFAKVDTSNPEEVEAAIYLGLCLISGANMQQAQQDGDVWDYVPGSPDWGGHCTAQDGYDDRDELETISWGSHQYRMTKAFLAHCVDELYFVITQDLADHPGFRDHLSLEQFAAAFHALTGREWTYTPTPTPEPPAPTPPQPTPPAPTPPNGGGASFQVSSELAYRVGQTAARHHLTADAWVEIHLRRYFDMPRLDWPGT